MAAELRSRFVGGKYQIDSAYVPPKKDYPLKYRLNEGEDFLRTYHTPFDVGLGGDSYWRPEILSRTMYQAESGKIPVSGAGYGGPFAGRGFDSIWLDMSEIVRPTRDGIHGREYISTSVELGRKNRLVRFDSKGDLRDVTPHNLSIPVPILFNPLPLEHVGLGADVAVASAAKKLGTYSVISEGMLSSEFEPYLGNVCVRVGAFSKNTASILKKVRMVEVDGSVAYRALSKKIRASNPDILVSVSVKLRAGVEGEVLRLFRSGVDIVHLRADHYGREFGDKPRHMTDVVSAVHDNLVAEGIRYMASIIVSGGIADAEHIPKILICGADAVAIDYSLVVALGCGLWADTRYPCIFEHEATDPVWGSNRIVNLVGAWRNQILEVMGAMGLREIRRLRGERGRAIFYKNEEKAFMEYLGVKGKVSYPIIDSRYSIGDCRWTPELIRATFEQARTGRPPVAEKSYKRGASGGGFDRLYFPFEKDVEDYDLKSLRKIDVSIELNKRKTGKRITMPYPIYMGGMSFGSVSLNVMRARARAAQKLGIFMSTGEGGYPDELIPYSKNIITQVATGLFGVSEQTLQRSRIMEFKYAQGAKPGLGGHLLANKVTETVARARESVAGRSLFSPFPFHSVYSVEDHKKHLDWIRSINPDILTIVKVSTPTDVDMVAVGSYYAGANIIDLDGSYGGTGAAPEISKKNIATPIEYAIPKVHKFLVEEGVREEVTLIASGGVRNAWDAAKAIALGADGCQVGTADLVAIGCERLGRCEKGDGCPMGITSTDPRFADLIDSEWAHKRVVNMHTSFKLQLQHIVKNLDLKNIRQLRGRPDLLRYDGGDGK